MKLYALARLEETLLSNWLRESGLAFFGSLTLHSLAMAFVVGINIAVSLRLAGFAQGIALRPFARFYALHWYGVLVIFLSGLALLLAYPAKALTNPVFYLKLIALSGGLVIARRFQKHLQDFDAPVGQDKNLKPLAWAALTLWIITIGAGRFLAYTHSVLLASRFY